jgi:hypothetical protein
VLFLTLSGDHPLSFPSDPMFSSMSTGGKESAGGKYPKGDSLPSVGVSGISLGASSDKWSGVLTFPGRTSERTLGTSCAEPPSTRVALVGHHE